MGLRILIVEDEVLIAETIRLYLRERGHQVTDCCISYQEAVAAYRRRKPDLVIIDIRLYGEKSGIDLARFLRLQKERTPFIFLTSQHDQRIFQLALSTTPHGYLAKPIQKESLWTTVDTAYRLHRQNEAPKSLSVITLFDGTTKHRVREQEIVCVKSEHVYSNVQLTDGRDILMRVPLSQFLKKVQSTLLLQCHRSYIVNTGHIQAWDNDSVTLSNGAVVPVSRSRRSLLMDRL